MCSSPQKKTLTPLIYLDIEVLHGEIGVPLHCSDKSAVTELRVLLIFGPRARAEEDHRSVGVSLMVLRGVRNQRPVPPLWMDADESLDGADIQDDRGLL
jgi:hypothetical protein